jgi:excisionase family DNA binding protein
MAREPIDRTLPLDQLPAVLTTQEIADWLGVSRQHVSNAVNTGKLEHRKLGRRVRVLREWVAAWLDSAEGARK